MTEQEKLSALYKKLISLYPPRFRDRFGESMAQTFNDLTFAETTIGILQEHFLKIKQGDGMNGIFSHPTSAAITSLILSVPLGLTFAAFMFDIEPLTKQLNQMFTINEQRGEINTLGRILIYGGLLLLPLAFALNVQPMLKRIGPDGRRKIYAFNLIIAVAIVLLIIFTWGGLIVEEIYCLRGIRCD